MKVLVEYFGVLFECAYRTMCGGFIWVEQLQTWQNWYLIFMNPIVEYI